MDGIEREIFTVVASQAVQEPPPRLIDVARITFAVLKERDEYLVEIADLVDNRTPYSRAQCHGNNGEQLFNRIVQPNDMVWSI